MNFKVGTKSIFISANVGEGKMEKVQKTLIYWIDLDT